MINKKAKIPSKYLYEKDHTTGAEYIKVSNNTVTETKMLSKRVNIDLDTNGAVVGVEII